MSLVPYLAVNQILILNLEMHTIKKISAADTYIVRHPILRAGKPIESCHFHGDFDTETQHFGLFLDNEIIGVASLFKNSLPTFNGSQMQLRGMAILKEHQHKGYGEVLLRAVEEYCREENVTILWFNARESALRFYRKLEYEVVGDSFEIPNIGLHYIMYKGIN